MSHHDGGGHSGGHHGEGFSGGSGGFFGNSNYDGDGLFDLEDLEIPDSSKRTFGYYAGWIVALIFIIACFCLTSLSHIPGFNIPNTIVFAVAFLLFFIYDFAGKGNTKEIKNFKHKDVPGGSGKICREWEEMRPYDYYGTEETWASHKGYYYSISFYNRDNRDSNLRQVYNTVHRTPSIIWVSSFVWMLLAIVCVLCNFFFYELIIPIFERANMTDITFTIMDEVVFYFPCSVALISSIVCLALGRTKHKILHACAKRIVEDNYATDVRLKTFGVIETRLGYKWFFDKCPNCGQEAPTDITTCEFCGTSLEALDADPDMPGIHRLSDIKVKE